MKNNQSYLLPHTFKYVGWGLFIAAFLFLPLAMYAFNSLQLIPQIYSRYATLILYLILFSSATLVALSKERYEDEMTKQIRSDAVTTTAYISFIIFTLSQFILAFDHAFRFIGASSLAYEILTRWLNPLTMFILYIAIFESKKIILKIRYRDEK